MEEPSDQEDEFGELIGPSNGQPKSVMRSFIESGERLEWTNEFGKVGQDKSHCQLFSHPTVKMERLFKGKCTVSRCDPEKAPTFPFKRPFVAKTLHGSSMYDQDMTKAEISVMKNLRHPHVAVFLGTWEQLGSLSILIFPAACFDLGCFMKHISDDLADLRNTASRRKDTSEPEFGTALPCIWSGPLSSSRPNVRHPCLQKLIMITRYFVCLSQALAYIHKRGVRHKDIKPKNILVDESGSAVVTDFGISKHFAVNISHDTHEDRKFDPKYVSPEMYENLPRGDLSDVFSLGCVFLEMATLLLGKTHEDLGNHYLPEVPDDLPVTDGGYHRNLDAVYEWINVLRGLPADGATEPEGGGSNSRHLSYQDFKSRRAPWNHKMIAALPNIQSMMARDATNRPEAESLWSHFEDIAPDQCRDCHPRHKKVWIPTAAQEAAADEDFEDRRLFALSSDERDEDGKRRRESSSGMSVQKVEQRRSIPSVPIPMVAKPPDEHENEPSVRSLSLDKGGQRHRPRIQLQQGPGGDPESLSRLISDIWPSAPAQLPHHQQQISQSDALSHKRSESAVKDVVISKSGGLLDGHQGRDPAMLSREIVNATGEITGSETHGNPEIDDARTDILIYDYKQKKACVIPFGFFQGLQKYTKHRIPRFGRNVALYNEYGVQNGELRLGGGLSISLQRALGRFPEIYVINRPSDQVSRH